MQIEVLLLNHVQTSHFFNLENSDTPIKTNLNGLLQSIDGEFLTNPITPSRVLPALSVDYDALKRGTSKRIYVTENVPLAIRSTFPEKIFDDAVYQLRGVIGLIPYYVQHLNIARDSYEGYNPHTLEILKVFEKGKP